MSRRQTTLDNGLAVDQIAASALRVYVLCVTGSAGGQADLAMLDALQVDTGWLNVSQTAAGMYAATSESPLEMTTVELAQELRASFFRGLYGEEPVVPFESTPVRERLAWEMVGRHLCWMTQADDEGGELRKLATVELSWVDRMAPLATKRGVTLEQPSTGEPDPAPNG